jgi:hypothetical protein
MIVPITPNPMAAIMRPPSVNAAVLPASNTAKPPWCKKHP